MSSATIIRSARKRAGLTQAELAGRLGKSQSEIGRWERGQARPSFETLTQVVRACGLDLTAQVSAADDSYAPHIERMLRLRPADRVRRAAEHANSLRMMRRAARVAARG
jgi:transcriptional regulator with XRE-family HTH domain